MSLAHHFRPDRTPQSEPIPGTVPNNAGGHSFVLDDWKRLDAFLVLGTEGGTYHVDERKLTRDNAAVVVRCLQADPRRTVDAILAIDVAGCAPRRDPAFLALAVALSSALPEARQAAYAAMPAMCRTGGDVLRLASVVDGWRGWSRGMRRAFARFYLDRGVDSVAHQLVKYRSRGLKGLQPWTHRDVLRMAHPAVPADAPDAAARQSLLRWATGRKDVDVGTLPVVVQAFTSLEGVTSAHEVARIVTEAGLPREALETEHLRSAEVWRALLPHMRPEAMVRSLGVMTRAGVLAPLSAETAHVVATVTDTERLRKARIHPFLLLNALRTYASGGANRSFVRTDGREAATWEPVTAVIDALDKAFYASFAAVEPTNRRLYLALDVSGSMGTSMIAKSSLSAREGSAAMALVTMATEPRVHVAGFAAAPGGRYGAAAMRPLTISPRQRLDDVVKAVSDIPFGGTDCSLPMRDALAKGLQVDAFVVYTDSETWAGEVHAMEALREYRRKSGIPAKLVVVGMVSNGFTIADPADGGTLDVVGFDASAPSVISRFVAG